MTIYVVRQTIDWQDGTWASPRNLFGKKTEKEARETCIRLQTHHNKSFCKYKVIVFYEELDIL